MRLEIDMPEHHYNNIMAFGSVNLGRVPYKGIIMYAINAIKHGRVLEQESTTKNNLGVDCIDRAELLKAMDTWDKFGYTETGCFVRAPKNDYVPYVHYEDMVKCVKGMPSVTPQEPKTGYLSIDDVMSVFDDFMCGEVDEDGTETFLEMLKDKAESEEV